MRCRGHNGPNQSYTFDSVGPNGDVNEMEISAAQALDLAAGKPITLIPSSEDKVIDEDGTITWREDAR